MTQAKDTTVRLQRDGEEAARAAWLHFVGGLTQSEVAKRLAISPTRAHRHIAKAQADGLVRVFVDVKAGSCVALETALMARFGLSRCSVAMEVPEASALPLRALSVCGADFIMQAISSGQYPVIGVGNGRTIAAAVNAIARVRATETRFVSMLGGLTRSFAANPYDVIYGLAQKTDAEAYLLPAPLYADTPADKDIMMGQSGIAATMELIDEANLAVVGIGNLDFLGGTPPASSLRNEEEARALFNSGARAEILGQFVTGDGAIMKTRHDSHVMAPALESLRGREVVAIAGGENKLQAVEAALRSGLLTGLIIDERTARGLIGETHAEEIAAE